MDLDHDLDTNPNTTLLDQEEGFDLLLAQAEEAEHDLLTAAQASTTVVPMTTQTPNPTEDLHTLEQMAQAVAENKQRLMDVLISDIDGSLDTLVGTSLFTDAEVRKALEDIAQRIGYCIQNLDDNS